MEADGSPKPKDPEPVVYEPVSPPILSCTIHTSTITAVQAPGTFGYDATKYRRRQDPNQAELIPMDEFGQIPNPPPDTLQIPSPTAEDPTQSHSPSHSQPPSPMPHTPRSFDRSVRAESPPPFAHYVRQEGMPSPQVGMQTLGPLPPANQGQVRAEEDSGAGCCKCVIM